MNTAISIEGIEKSFNKQKVLNNLNLIIPQKSVFFLLGLNGAGKTTLMKIMLGLLYPDAGNIDFGNYNKEFGFLIETPNFYEHLTAYQNLKHHALLLGCEESEIKRVLEIVKLNPKNKKRVSSYSLGMKQRLGLARALMGDHDYIMLDEPLNGLDPAGMDEFKDIIKELNSKYGKTIILSSHLIKETENLATDYAIIHEGETFTQFSQKDLLENCKKLYIRCNNNEPEIVDLLKTTVSVAYVKKGNDINVYTKQDISELVLLLEKIKENGYDCIAEMTQGNLEELFLAITKGGAASVSYN